MKTNKNLQYLAITSLIIVAVCFSLNSVARRMQYIMQKQFCYTLGNKTSTININYLSKTKVIGEVTVAETGSDNAESVGFNGDIVYGNYVNRSWNEEAPTFKDGYKNSIQKWHIYKGKSGREYMTVRYYSQSKPTKYVTYTYKACVE